MTYPGPDDLLVLQEDGTATPEPRTPRTEPRYPYAIEFDAEEGWVTVTDPEGASQIVAQGATLTGFEVLFAAITANVQYEAARKAESPPSLREVIEQAEAHADVAGDDGNMAYVPAGVLREWATTLRAALSGAESPASGELRVRWLEGEVRRLAAIVGEAPQVYDPATVPPETVANPRDGLDVEPSSGVVAAIVAAGASLDVAMRAAELLSAHEDTPKPERDWHEIHFPVVEDTPDSPTPEPER